MSKMTYLVSFYSVSINSIHSKRWSCCYNYPVQPTKMKTPKRTRLVLLFHTCENQEYSIYSSTFSPYPHTHSLVKLGKSKFICICTVYSADYCPTIVPLYSRRSSVKKLLLKVFQNSQQNTCAKISEIKKDPGNLTKFLRGALYYRARPRDCFCILTSPCRYIHKMRKPVYLIFIICITHLGYGVEADFNSFALSYFCQ